MLSDVDVQFAQHLVIGVSQSGRTPEIARYLAHAARQEGAHRRAHQRRHEPGGGRGGSRRRSGRGRGAGGAGDEAVTVEIVGFALLAAAGGATLGKEAWNRLPAHVAAVLCDGEPMRELTVWLGHARQRAAVARGLLFGAAQETGLKLQETVFLLATAFSAAGLRHGPIALNGGGIPALALAHPGPAGDDVLSQCHELGARSADLRMLDPVEGRRAGGTPTPSSCWRRCWRWSGASSWPTSSPAGRASTRTNPPACRRSP